jgi:hypothetical protein
VLDLEIPLLQMFAKKFVVNEEGVLKKMFFLQFKEETIIH